MSGGEIVGEINESRALFGYEDILHFGVFGQRRQHRVALRSGLKTLKDLPCAVTDVRRFEDHLLLREKQNVSRRRGKKHFNGHRWIRRQVQGLRRRLEWIFLGFMLVHHRPDSADDVDEKSHRDRSGNRQHDERDFNTSRHGLVCRRLRSLGEPLHGIGNRICQPCLKTAVYESLCIRRIVEIAQFDH